MVCVVEWFGDLVFDIVIICMVCFLEISVVGEFIIIWVLKLVGVLVYCVLVCELID